MLKLKKDVNDINRLREIITILIEEGFSFLIFQLKIKHPRLFLKKFRQKDKILNNPERFVRTLERLGPTFIKLGQLLSIRPDLIPIEYVHALEKLQDEVKQNHFDSIKVILKQEHKKDIHKIFSKFNKEPIASASISQVYDARLKNGKRVAVKVLRPKVKERFMKDIDIMFYLANLLERRIPKSKDYSPVGIVEEFAKWTIREIDLRNEARNAKRFKRNFKDSKKVYIPKVYEDLTTEKVLVEEFVDGVDLHDYFKKKRKKELVIRIVNQGIDITLTQVFIHGFFHADPHPGNIKVMKNGKLCLLDFGIVGFFNERLKNLSLNLMYGIIKNDYDKLANSVLEFGKVNKETIDMDSFKNELMDILEPLENKSIGEIKLSYTLEKLFEISLRYKIRPDHSFVILAKTLMELEGIALKYNKNLKVIDQMRPFLEHLILEKTKPKNIVMTMIKEAKEIISLSRRLPVEAEKALTKIKKGDFKVNINETELKRLSLEIDRSSNRVTYGVLISSFLITGALIIDIGSPKYYDIPLFSFLLFLFAGIIFLVLLLSIYNERQINKW